MTRKNPSDTMFWNDWANDPNLRACSLAARGLWMEMLCIMARAIPYGELRIERKPLSNDELARMVGATPRAVEILLQELSEKNVYSLTRKQVIYNRRMKRSRNLSETRAKAGSKGGMVTNERIREITGLVQQNQQQTPQQTRSPSSSYSSESSIININKKGAQQKKVFPSGSIRYTEFEPIAKEHGNGWDVDMIGDAFRPWAKKNKITPENMIKAFTGFCKTNSKNKGAA